MSAPEISRTVRALLEHQALVRPSAVYALAVPAEPAASTAAPTQLSFAELARSSPIANPEKQLRLINGYYGGGEPKAGQLVKVVQGL